MTDRTAATAAAHQQLSRVLRNEGEAALGAIEEVRKALSFMPAAQEQLQGAMDRLRKVHALDAEDMKDWRAKGGG